MKLNRKKMKKQFVIATVMVAVLLLSVLMVPPVMSGLGDENTTSMNKTNEDSIAVQRTWNTAEDGWPARDWIPDWVVFWDPWGYDTNGNGIIEKSEVGNAAKDYFDDKITMEQVLEVMLLYFASQHE